MNNSKYPTSKNNHQCLGPCYEPNEWSIHPIKLSHIRDTKNPYCHINDIVTKDHITGKTETQIIDDCMKATSKKERDEYDSSLDTIVPYLAFDSGQFLKIYYNLYSMNDILDWFDENKYVPYYTKRRIIDCGWKSYIFTEDDILDERISNLYIEFIKKKGMTELYKKIYNYISIKDKKIYLLKNNDNIQDKSVEKMNYIIDKFINIQQIQKYINSYIKIYEKEIKDGVIIDSHTDNIIKGFNVYIEHKIEATIKEKS